MGFSETMTENEVAKELQKIDQMAKMLMLLEERQQEKENKVNQRQLKVKQQRKGSITITHRRAQ